MDAVLDRREEIYNWFHANSPCQEYFFEDANEEKYVAYYNSMYLLQDTTESLWWHRGQGFSSEPMHAYIEFWGVMQAVIIQQDAIAQLYEVIFETKLEWKNLTAWREIRELRHVCVGHPVVKDRPKTDPISRTFMGRAFGGYKAFTYEKWEQGTGTTHPEVKLGELLDTYADEAAAQLTTVLAKMCSNWP
jgi:hypothetical protein